MCWQGFLAWKVLRITLIRASSSGRARDGRSGEEGRRLWSTFDVCNEKPQRLLCIRHRPMASTICAGRSAGIGSPCIQESSSLFSPNMKRACGSSKSSSKGVNRINIMRFFCDCANLLPKYVQAVCRRICLPHRQTGGKQKRCGLPQQSTTFRHRLKPRSLSEMSLETSCGRELVVHLPECVLVMSGTPSSGASPE